MANAIVQELVSAVPQTDMNNREIYLTIAPELSPSRQFTCQPHRNMCVVNNSFRRKFPGMYYIQTVCIQEIVSTLDIYTFMDKIGMCLCMQKFTPHYYLVNWLLCNRWLLITKNSPSNNSRHTLSPSGN